MSADANNGNGLITVNGTVENIIYYNEENSYAVFDVSTDDYDGILTANGYIPDLNEGEGIKLVGKWKNHYSYGKQFYFSYYELILPSTENEILRYLSSGAVKGIGPKTAKRIVDKFGTEAFDIIENHPDWLAQLPGISAKKAAEISDNFKEQSGIRSLVMFCRDYLSAALSVKVYKKWGGSAVELIKSNPYRLCEEIDGIGFAKADSLAKSMGIENDSLYRLKSGIRYVLNEASRTGGHSFLPYERLCSAASEKLGVSPERISEVTGIMLEERRLSRIKVQGIDALYDYFALQTEAEIEAKLDLIDRVCPSLDSSDIARLIERIELEEEKQYAAMQRKAIYDVLGNGVTVLTGGPGTGKTTVIRAIIRIFSEMNQKIALAAPTGRAAKRMSEATSAEAKTIHRLLEMDFSDESGNSFRKNENDLLDEDIIIIDEASMIDMYLMNSLLKAIKPGARLMLIGDADQLPSVGAGNVLNDIIESERFCVVKLAEIFRQAEKSLIVTNSHRINNGELPVLNSKDNDFFFVRRDTDRSIAQTVVDLCKNRLPRTYGEDTVSRIQVISPSRKGTAGTENLNLLLQEALNPPEKTKLEKKLPSKIFREGDRVMQIKYDYEIEWEIGSKTGSGIFNGDIGTVETVNDSGNYLVIDFDGRTVKYDYSRLDELEHAYAITVHKSQGSEYPIVIIPMYWGCPPMLLSRNLLYTAVTRAKKMVILVGSADVVSKMVANVRQIMRYTGLFKK